MIETATGAVEGSALGFTLMHEHICVGSDGVAQAFPRLFDRAGAVSQAITQVTAVADLGVRTIVDVTVMGQGRDIGVIADVAAAVPANIVVATGAYTFADLPRYFQNRPTETLAEQFVADIRDGIGESGIRAAVIKCTTDEQGVTPDIDKLLRATAMAQRETDVLISTHTHAPSRSGVEQLRIFAEEGVDLSRVVIGHSGDTDDLDYLMRIADSGALLGMDRFGLDRRLPFDQRVGTIIELVRRGYGDRVVLSHDYCCYIDWVPGDSPLLQGLAMDHIPLRVLPALRRAGLGAEEVRRLIVNNPRRALTGSEVD